jgi:hypothetical protein
MGLESSKSVIMMTEEREHKKLIANVQSLTNESEVNILRRRALQRRNKDLCNEHSYVCDLLASLLEEVYAREEAFTCVMNQKSAEWKEKEKAYQSRIKTLEKANSTTTTTLSVSVDHTTTKREDKLRASETSSGGADPKAKEIKRRSKMRDRF